MPMTQEGFIRKKGEQCPYCGAKAVAIKASAIVVNTLMSREAICAICKKEWHEDYTIKPKLTGYREKK